MTYQADGQCWKSLFVQAMGASQKSHLNIIAFHYLMAIFECIASFLDKTDATTSHRQRMTPPAV
jgi:hypothetical protein